MPPSGHLWCNRVPAGGAVCLFVGGASNARGNNAATSDPALLGYVLPEDATYYEDGVLQASYPATHFGPEVGIIDELVVRGVSASRITVIKHGVPGSNLTGWISTYWSELNTVYATSGYPIHGLVIQGSADAEASGAANAYATNMLDLIGRFRRDRGAGIGVTWALLNRDLDPVDKPFAATVRAAQVAQALVIQGLRTLEIDDLPTDASDPEDKHYIGTSQVTIGRRYVAQLFEQSVLTT